MCDLNQLLSFVLDNPKELFGTQKEGTPSLLVVFIMSPPKEGYNRLREPVKTETEIITSVMHLDINGHHNVEAHIKKVSRAVGDLRHPAPPHLQFANCREE